MHVVVGLAPRLYPNDARKVSSAGKTDTETMTSASVDAEVTSRARFVPTTLRRERGNSADQHVVSVGA